MENAEIRIKIEERIEGKNNYKGIYAHRRGCLCFGCTQYRGEYYPNMEQLCFNLMNAGGIKNPPPDCV